MHNFEITFFALLSADDLHTLQMPFSPHFLIVLWSEIKFSLFSFIRIIDNLGARERGKARQVIGRIYS